MVVKFVTKNGCRFLSTEQARNPAAGLLPPDKSIGATE
jgi:hypothetical protein